MPALSTLHNELRLRVPNKPYELYDDALRWAINHICVKTSLWKNVSQILTEPGVDVYDLDFPSGAVTHSNLYIVQKAPTSGGTDRIITRPINGFTNLARAGAPADWLQAFATHGQYQIKIAPTPVDGNVTLEVHTAIKLKTGATDVNEDKFFDEYKDTVVQGALYRLYDDTDIERSNRSRKTFRIGVCSIHIDVIKSNANTPLKVRAGW